MKILVACEESQAVTIELRKLGHEAYSCDIIECSGGHPEWHIMGDVLPLLNGNCSFDTVSGEVINGYVDTRHYIDGKWDMIIAFPPCTYISNAGACRLYPQKGVLDRERFQKGLQAKSFFMEFLHADCDKICVENPVHSKIFEMPQHTQEIQPYEYGHPVSKKTRLWLKGLDPLKSTNTVEKIGTYLPSGTSRYKGTQKNHGTAQGSTTRSKTFPGIAKAMAEQWCGKVE